MVEDQEGDKVDGRCPQDDVEGGGEVGKGGVVSLAYLDHQDGPGECDGNGSCAVQEAVIQLLVLGEDSHKGRNKSVPLHCTVCLQTESCIYGENP